MISVQLLIIHNFNHQRNPLIFNSIEKLKFDLQKSFNVSIKAIGYQPKLNHLNRRTIIKYFFNFYSTNYAWSLYRLKRKNLISLLIKYLFLFLYDFFRISLLKYKSFNDFIALQTLITDKHLRAWDFFLESNADVLLVFEDDAVFKENTNEELIHGIKLVSEVDNSGKLYFVDFGGGYPLEALAIDKLLLNRHNNLLVFERPVTNTACGYMTVRNTVDYMKTIVIENPGIRYFGIDWLMNFTFITSLKRKVYIICLHYFPSATLHGSFQGKFDAWRV